MRHKNSVLRLILQVDAAWRSVNFSSIQRAYSSHRWHFLNRVKGVFVFMLMVLAQQLQRYFCDPPDFPHFLKCVEEH